MEGQTFTHFGVGANVWALANGINACVARLVEEGGSQNLERYGHGVYEFSRPVTLDEVEVSPLDGALSAAEDVGVKPVEIHRSWADKQKDTSTNEPRYNGRTAKELVVALEEVYYGLEELASDVDDEDDSGGEIQNHAYELEVLFNQIGEALGMEEYGGVCS
tara:strand:+ start:2568 stop:3053 length:486 start_codon:yes stop_codon:yes gene_type:complete